MLINTSVAGGADGGVKSDKGCALAKPLPGPIKAATLSASVTAIAVVRMKRASVLRPTRPSTLTSPMPQTPQISEKVTSGTTSIFKALTNAAPTT